MLKNVLKIRDSMELRGAHISRGPGGSAALPAPRPSGPALGGGRGHDEDDGKDEDEDDGDHDELVHQRPPLDQRQDLPGPRHLRGGGEGGRLGMG